MLEIGSNTGGGSLNKFRPTKTSNEINKDVNTSSNENINQQTNKTTETVDLSKDTENLQEETKTLINTKLDNTDFLSYGYVSSSYARNSTNKVKLQTEYFKDNCKIYKVLVLDEYGNCTEEITDTDLSLEELASKYGKENLVLDIRSMDNVPIAWARAEDAINSSALESKTTTEKESKEIVVEDSQEQIIKDDNLKAEENKDKVLEDTKDTSNETTSNDELLVENFSVTVPSGLGTYATREFDLRSSTNGSGSGYLFPSGTNQRKVQEKWIESGASHDDQGFCKIGDRYLIACTTKYGNVGDLVDFTLSDGTVVKCVITDAKSQGDSGCNEWGHNGGANVLEFLGTNDIGNSPYTALGLTGTTVTQATNYGSIIE